MNIVLLATIIAFTVWHSGIKYKDKTHDKDDQYYVNRIALIKLILCLSSTTLYFPIKEAMTHINPMIWLFCSQWNTKVEQILYSLINFAFNYDTAYNVFYI